jgi:hypothetical protein
MRLLRRRPSSFDIQVGEFSLHVSVHQDLTEEARVAALSFWEQIESYALQHPEFRTSKRPIPEVPAGAPEIVREMAASAGNAGVGPMFTFRGALVDQVGRFLAGQAGDVTVSCDGDYFIKAKKRLKLGVKRPEAHPITIALPPSKGVGVSTTLGRGKGRGPDGLAVIADSCMGADAAAAGVQALLPKPDGFGMALHYLQRVPGVHGAIVVVGDKVGVAGAVEIAA